MKCLNTDVACACNHVFLFQSSGNTVTHHLLLQVKYKAVQESAHHPRTEAEMVFCVVPTLVDMLLKGSLLFSPW